MADPGHIETEAYLRLIEVQVKGVYEQAAAETEAKLKDYMERFKAKDSIKLKQVKEGKITQAEYTKWRTGQIMIGKRWSEMRDTLAADFVNADKIAASIVNGYMPDVYALNHNYATFEVEKGALVDTSYTLYDRQTVERLIRDRPDLLPQVKINDGEDWTWYRRQVTAATMQGILQGESLDKVAKRMGASVAGFGDRAAIRNARTSMTGAQNAGRVDGYKRAQGMGIEMQQEWVATLDARTRDSHAVMDGERIEVGKKFSNGCRYPGDPAGPPAEVWNCRCTIVAALEGFGTGNEGRFSRLEDEEETYDEWKARHQKSIDEREARRRTKEQRSGMYISVNKQNLMQYMSEERADAIIDLINKCEDKNVAQAYANGINRGNIKITDTSSTGDGNYCAWDENNTVYINMDDTSGPLTAKNTPYKSFFHEMAHALDGEKLYDEDGIFSYLYGNKALDKAIKADFKRSMEEMIIPEFRKSLKPGDLSNPKEGSAEEKRRALEYVIGNGNILYPQPDFAFNAHKWTYNMLFRDTQEISDVTEYASGMGQALSYGHGKKYWKENKRRGAAEFMAGYMSAVVTSPDSVSLLKRMYPTACGIMDDIIKELI